MLYKFPSSYCGKKSLVTVNIKTSLNLRQIVGFFTPFRFGIDGSASKLRRFLDDGAVDADVVVLIEFDRKMVSTKAAGGS